MICWVSTYAIKVKISNKLVARGCADREPDIPVESGQVAYVIHCQQAQLVSIIIARKGRID